MSVKTYVKEGTRRVYHTSLGVNLCCNSFVSMHVCIDPKFVINFSITDLMGANMKILLNGFQFADRFHKDCDSESVGNLHSLIGVNALPFLRHLSVIKCLTGLHCKHARVL